MTLYQYTAHCDATSWIEPHRVASRRATESPSANVEGFSLSMQTGTAHEYVFSVYLSFAWLTARSCSLPCIKHIVCRWFHARTIALALFRGDRREDAAGRAPVRGEVEADELLPGEHILGRPRAFLRSQPRATACALTLVAALVASSA